MESFYAELRGLGSLTEEILSVDSAGMEKLEEPGIKPKVKLISFAER